MREGSVSTAAKMSTREDIVPDQRDVETIPGGGRVDQERAADEREEKLASERAVATQRLIWDNRRFIFWAAAAGLLLSVLIAFLIPKRFQSTARLMPPDQGGGSGMALLAAASGQVGGAGSALEGMAGDLLGLKNSSDLFIGILQSRTVQDDLIDKFDLKKVYSEKQMEEAREDLGKRTIVSADRKSGIIQIVVVDNNPLRAAAMAGEYIGELNRVVTQLNTSSAHREREFLEQRLVQVKEDLENAERSFSEFASKNTALDIPAQGKAMIEGMGVLEGQLIAAQTELEGLKQIYADGNVRVRSTQARVDELRRQLAQSLGGKSGGPATSGGSNRASLYPSLRELPALGVTYADMYRNTKIQEAVFQTLTQQYELAKVQEAKETPSVKILDPSDVPEKKSFPPRLLIMALGTMLAMAAGTVWVIGKQRWDEVEPGNPQKVFALEVLYTFRDHLPRVTTKGSGASFMSEKVWSRFRRSKDQAQSEM